MQFAIITRESAGFIQVLASRLDADLDPDGTISSTPQPVVTIEDDFVSLDRNTIFGPNRYYRLTIFENAEEATKYMKKCIGKSENWAKIDTVIFDDTASKIDYIYKAVLLEDIESIIEKELLE